MGPVRVGAAGGSAAVAATAATAVAVTEKKGRPQPQPGQPAAISSAAHGESESESSSRFVETKEEEEHESGEEEVESERPLLLPSALRSSLRGGLHHGSTGTGGSESQARMLTPAPSARTSSRSPQKVLFASSSFNKKSKKGFPSQKAPGGSGSSSSSNKATALVLLSAVLPSFRKGGGEEEDASRQRRQRRRGGGGRGAGRDSGWWEGRDHQGDVDGEGEYDDPVMALFQARASHRVTFCLEQQMQMQQQQQQNVPGRSSSRQRRKRRQHQKLQQQQQQQANESDSGQRTAVQRGRAAHPKEEGGGAGAAPASPQPRRSSSLKRFVQAALFGGPSKHGQPTAMSMADIEAEVAQVQSGDGSTGPTLSPSPPSSSKDVAKGSDDDSDSDDDNMAPNPALRQYMGNNGGPDDASSLLPSASASSAASVSSGHTSAAVPTAGSPSPPRDRLRRRHYGGLGKGGTADSSDGSEPPPLPQLPQLSQQQQQQPPPIQFHPAGSPSAAPSEPSAVTTPKRRGIRWGHGQSDHSGGKSPTASKSNKASSPKAAGAAAALPFSGSALKTSSSSSSPHQFVEQKQVRSQINVLLNKASRAHHVHHRYEYAIKCCMKALELQKRAGYPEDHPAVLKTLQYLNTAHHALSSLENSANIVKMGIKYEDAGDLIRALKMYTIAYRIRRDNLSRSHPSLVVLLNMLGSIQVKRDELEEAMEIFELALKDDPRLMGDDGTRRNDGGGGTAGAEGDDEEEDDADDSDSVNRDDEGGRHVHEHKEADLSPPRHRRKVGRSRPDRKGGATTNNVLAKSVAYREMGIIYERWGDADEALKMYHRSLDCIAEYKGLAWEPPVVSRHAPTLALTADDGPPPRRAIPIVSPSPVAAASTPSPSRSASTSRDTRSPSRSVTNTSSSADEDVNNTTISSCPVSLSNEEDVLLDLESVQLSRSFVKHATVVKSHKEDDGQFESGMELFLNGDDDGSSRTTPAPLVTSTCYDAFFQGASPNAGRKRNKSKDASTANVDVALTLHQIGQLHRAEGEYNLALAAYAVSLRGMREELGKNHPNVAAILGNVGNLQKEMGDLTAAYETYQQVLAIESYRLGLSHPDVSVTLHNIATIEAARGNHQNALTLYNQVLSLQRKLFGEDHLSLAVTATCMGDVYERIGEIDKAIDAFDEALRIKTAVSGRHSIEVGRILHKLGKLSALNGDVQLADSYLSRTVLIYRLNKMRDDDGWMIEVNRDVADIDALIAMGRSEDLFEC